jgi:hypothetical protein
LDLGVLEILVDLLNEVGSKLLLLTLTDGGLITDPGVESTLELRSDSYLLLQLKSLSLKLGSIARKSEKILGNINNVLHLTNLVDTLSDSALVVVACLVENVLDTLYTK